MEFKSYAFTVRPKNGLSSELEDRIISWLKKQDYGFAVIEKDGEARHMHGQIFCHVPRTKSAVQLSLERIQEALDPDWCPASKKVLRRGVKIAYSSDFIEEYLNKPDSKVIFNNPPEDEAPFYPSQEEQDKVKDQANAVDKRMHHISMLYETFSDDNPLLEGVILPEEKVARFLYDAWYISKTLPTLQNLRSERELMRRVRHYIFPHPDNFKQLIPEEKKRYLKENKDSLEIK